MPVEPIAGRRALPVRSLDVDAIWPLVRPFIERALAAGDGGHAAEDVRRLCAARDAQLWLGLGAGGLEMVAVTEIRGLPRTRIARVWLLAGIDARGWIEECLPAIEDWARAEGCAALELVGRKGWLRRLPAAGWSHTQVVMRKELRP
jgi:hypothetical protein